MTDRASMTGSQSRRWRGEEDREYRIHSLVESMRPFQDHGGACYFLFERPSGPPTYLEYESGLFRGKLAMIHLERFGEAITRRDEDMACGLVQAIAAGKPKRDVWIRSAFLPGGPSSGVALDLANDEGGMMVVTPAEIRYEPGSADPPCYFRRPDGMRPLPSSLPGSTPVLDLLQSVAPLPDYDSQLLRLAFLLACLWPEGPYPILSLTGPPESGKGFHAAVVRELADPVHGGFQGWPRSEEELLEQATGLRLLVLDNISQVPPWAFDALCRLSTGGALRKRRLYSQRAMATQPSKSPVIITSVDRILTTPDLVSRSMLIQLPHVPDEGRWDETMALDRVRAAAPYIIHELLSIVQGALFIRPEDITTTSRITPVFRLMAAAEARYGWFPGTFLRAYGRNRGAGHDTILSEYAWCEVIGRILADNGGEWEGTYSELLQVLRGRLSFRGENFPNSAKMLSLQIARVQQSFLDMGIRFELDMARTRVGKKVRIWR